jgi:hypothetical protein
LAKSVVGTRSELKRPRVVMTSVDSLPSVTLPRAAKVEVTELDAETKPAKSSRVVVVKLPRAVTD